MLIYGKFGFPALGVAGAALATVISRYVEVAIVVAWTHSHKEKAEFARGLYSTLFIPRELTAKIIKTGTPLLVNETRYGYAYPVLFRKRS